jgi:hypothetical protein
MRLFWFAIILTFVVLGCSDGKLNLLLVFWGDSEEPSSSSFERNQEESSSSRLSSSSLEIPPSSGEEPPTYSSGEEPPPLSSGEVPPPSSSSRGTTRSSSSKEYLDYPVLEEGAEGVFYGWATRYWDGCKPHCSWLEHNVNKQSPKPWNGICKNCDKNNKEVTTYERHQTWTEWWAGYLSIKSSCDPQGHPNPTYACWDMAPIAINDTLAYGFAAMSPEIAECGVCYQLVFDGGWNDKELPRPTNRAVRGKTMIVMASNIGYDVEYNNTMRNGRIGTQFDILIPGGGVGAFNSVSDQLGLNINQVGEGYGGLLNHCLNNGVNEVLKDSIRDGSHRASVAQMQECLRIECKNFAKSPELYNGCLWHADWFMAVDNPTLHYKKVDCPKYLIDKYYSSIDTGPPPLPDPYPMVGCTIEGSIDCKETGWY